MQEETKEEKVHEIRMYLNQPTYERMLYLRKRLGRKQKQLIEQLFLQGLKEVEQRLRRHEEKKKNYKPAEDILL